MLQLHAQNSSATFCDGKPGMFPNCSGQSLTSCTCFLFLPLRGPHGPRSSQVRSRGLSIWCIGERRHYHRHGRIVGGALGVFRARNRDLLRSRCGCSANMAGNCMRIGRCVCVRVCAQREREGESVGVGGPRVCVLLGEPRTIGEQLLEVVVAPEAQQQDSILGCRRRWKVVVLPPLSQPDLPIACVASQLGHLRLLRDRCVGGGSPKVRPSRPQVACLAGVVYMNAVVLLSLTLLLLERDWSIMKRKSPLVGMRACKQYRSRGQETSPLRQLIGRVAFARRPTVVQRVL